MDWLRDHDWETWLIVALLLAGAEMATLDFTLLMMAVVAVALLAFVRPSIAKRLHAGPTVQNGPQALVGQSGLVLERVTGLNGRVRLRGEVWSARAVDDTLDIEPGAKVGVAEID